jgi:catechol 2,3-dioxygenase-like lactoylglutathione lyase family enzyme
LYPVIRDVAAARDFYVRHFGFEVTFSRPTGRPDAAQYELALLDHSRPTLPDGHRGLTLTRP